jgi:uncharacterized protein
MIMKIKILLIHLFLSISSFMCAQEQKSEFEAPVGILVFSGTSGFRHESISTGVKMLYELSASQKWTITATESPALFNDEVLRNMDVVVFLNPSGDVLNNDQQASFERFMKRGKGMIGIHSAADFEYDWPFYAQLIGAHFKSHPPSQEATVLFESYDHPAMKPFKGMKSYTTFDEWYTFRTNPRSDVNVLATLDESSIKKADNDEWKMGDHPLIWWQETNGMRSFYTGFGHTHEAFQDQKIIDHIKNAINWAAKRL